LYSKGTHHAELLALLGALLQVEMGNVLGVVGAGRDGAHALVVLAAHVALEPVGESQAAAAQDDGHQDGQCLHMVAGRNRSQSQSRRG